MNTQNDHPAEMPVTEKKRWVPPTSEPQGSVSDLVQLAKVSNGEDTEGKRFVPDGGVGGRGRGGD